MDDKKECEWCGKALRPFTGKRAFDWKARNYHRTCWKLKFEQFAKEELFASIQPPDPPAPTS